MRGESVSTAAPRPKPANRAFDRQYAADALLICLVISIVVAASGVVIQVTTIHDLLGIALLIGGDLGAITGFVIYLCWTG